MLENTEEGSGAGVVAPRVEYTRKWNTDCVFGIIFVVCVLLHLFVGISHMASSNMVDANFTFTTEKNGVVQEHTIYYPVPNEELKQEQQKCLDALSGGNRMLESEEAYNPNDHLTMWQVLAQNIGIPAIPFFMVPVLTAGWLFLLQKFAVTISWLTVGIGCAIPVAIGAMIWHTLGHFETVCALWIAFGVILAGIAFFYRKSVTKGGQHLSVACKALEENWSVFVATFLLQLIFTGFLIFTFFALWSFDETRAVDPITCALVAPPGQSSASTFMLAMVVWMSYYFNGMKLVVTAMSIGSWFFQQARPDNHALTGLKTAFTTSAGTIAFASLVVTITQQLMKYAKSKTAWLTPFGCIAKVLLCCLQRLLETFGKYSLIAHVLSDDPLCKSGKNAINVLKKNLGGAAVQDRVGSAVVHYGAYAFSLVIGFSTWAAVDGIMGWSTLGSGADLGGTVWFWIIIVFYAYLNFYPIPFIMIIIMVANFSFVQGAVTAPMIAMFVSAIASLFFNFQGDIILYAMDTIIFVYAVGRGNGVGVVEGREVMYAVLGDLVEEEAAYAKTLDAPLTANAGAAAGAVPVAVGKPL